MSQDRLSVPPLSIPDIESIEQTAFRLLDEVGIRLHHPTAIENLCGLGCRVEKDRVFIPRDAAIWGLNHIRPFPLFHRRDGTPAFKLGDGRLRFHNSGGIPFALDPDTGQRGNALIKDVEQATRMMDALPHVEVVLPLFAPQDVHPELLAVASTDILFRNTGKPVGTAPVDKPAYVSYLVEMAAACCGGKDMLMEKPWVFIPVSPVSPLIFTHDVTQSIMEVVSSGIPLMPLPAPALGATGPITLAGSLAQQHAELLACFLIAATARDGAKVLYSSRINPMDMRTATSSWGGPEVGMAGACAAQLAHRLGLSCDTYGLCTNAMLPDAQFGFQRFANALLPALSGADILSGVGSLDSGLAGSLAVAVMDNEIIDMIKHLLNTPSVTHETLALDLMKTVIPRDGVFLSELHTVQQMRKGALWHPGLTGQSVDKEIDFSKRAGAKANELLKTHTVDPLPESILKELDRIMEKARRELVK
jgi:trimethylamine---corrinoid protein Co-methyltransferase